MLTVAELRASYPEFAAATYADAKVTAAIKIADELAGPATAAARTALTAHVLAASALNTGKPDGGVGEVIHERVGSKGLHVKPMAARPTDVWFTSTPYGRLYLVLDEGRGGLPMVV